MYERLVFCRSQSLKTEHKTMKGRICVNTLLSELERFKFEGETFSLRNDIMRLYNKSLIVEVYQSFENFVRRR